MKIALVFLVAVTVFTSLLLESSAAPNFISGITAKIGDTIRAVGDTAGNIVEGAGKLADNGKDVVINKVTEDIKTVKESIAKLVDGVESTLNKATETAATLGGELGEKLKEALIKLKITLKKVVELVKKILEAIAGGADDTIKELKGNLKAVVSKLKADIAAVNEIVEQISEKAGNDVSIIIDNVKEILAKIEKFVESLLSKVTEAEKSKTTEIADGDKKMDNAALKEFALKEIETCVTALSELKSAVKKYLTEGTDDEKICLDFIKKFEPLVDEIHADMKADVNVNDPKNREKLIKIIIKAIKDTKETAASVVAKLQGDKIKEVFKKTIIGVIVPGAVEYVKMLKKSLPTGNDANQ